MSWFYYKDFIMMHGHMNVKMTCYALECVSLYRMLGVDCFLQYQHFSVFFPPYFLLLL
jgi:hypothetical protein